ncbi:hypothetical protein TNCV_5046691 [Trichonephila clavipes]|nr:hypothetical protein TNCV_5046691 [Trichonephila clavipes]
MANLAVPDFSGGGEICQDGNTEHRAVSQRPPIINSREDRHVTHMALMGCATLSLALDQKLESFTRQQGTARTVRRHLQQHRLSAQKP